MPVVRELSGSPRRRNLSMSPDPNIPGSSTQPRVKKPRLSEVDIQQYHLSKLFANPDREIEMPQPRVEPVYEVKEKEIRPTNDVIKNIQASSAAAGSGEFHVYKHSRRREAERIKNMERRNREEIEQAEFLARQEARDEAADAKTAKNRAKRQKRKGGNKGQAASESTTHGGGGAAAGGGLKRKLAGGAAVVFKRPGEESEEEDDGGEDGSREDVSSAPVVQEEPRAMAVEEREIIIHDDE